MNFVRVGICHLFDMIEMYVRATDEETKEQIIDLFDGYLQLECFTLDEFHVFGKNFLKTLEIENDDYIVEIISKLKNK